jgi:hypothetical protein
MQSQSITMKKLIAFVASVVSFSAIAFGQGTVLFGTSAWTITKVLVNNSVGGTTFTLTPADSSFYFALFASITTSSVLGSTGAIVGGTGLAGESNADYVYNDANWTFVSYGQSYGQAGKFAASGAVNLDDSTTIAFAAPGSPVNLVAIGWSGNIGTTYQSIGSFLAGDGPLFGWVGESAVATIYPGSVPGMGVVPYNNMFGENAGQVGGLQLGEVVAPSESGTTPDAGPIPEPATIALGLVGGLACLALRRKPF